MKLMERSVTSFKCALRCIITFLYHGSSHSVDFESCFVGHGWKLIAKYSNAICDRVSILSDVTLKSCHLFDILLFNGIFVCYSKRNVYNGESK